MKKTLSVLLSVVMLLCLVPTTVHAYNGAGTKDNPFNVSNYAELRQLIAEAPTDGTTRYIELGMNITSNDSNNDYALTTTNKNQTVVLDLNGKTITRNATITVDKSVIRAKEGTLTINDSVGTGGVFAKGVIDSAIGLISTDGIYSDEGTVIINGGTFEAAVKSGHGVYNESGTIYIFGGTFRGTYGLYAAAGKTVVYGGEFVSTSGNETRYSMTLYEDQRIELYNFTAHNVVRLNGAKWSLWDYIETDGNLYVDGVKQTRSSKKEYEGDTVRLETPVTYNLDMTVDEPTHGKTINNEGYTPIGANYFIAKENDNQIFQWFVGYDFASGTFKKNTVYRARMQVRVDGHISHFLTATVNGNEAVLELIAPADDFHDYARYWVEYTFPATIDNELSSAAVTVTLPTAGATANDGSFFSSKQYSARIYWSDSADLYNSNFGGKTFEAGKTYYADIHISTNSPYVFIDNSTITVNGKSYPAQWTVGEAYKNLISVYDVPFTVASAHTHSYKTLRSDANYHWYECSCGAKNGKEAHTYESDLQRATMSSAGYEQKVCSVCNKKKGTKRTIARLKSVELSKTSYTYDGKAKKPAVIGKDVNGKTVDLSKSFIDYDTGRKNVGTYEVYITLAGDYAGVYVRTFKINPKGTSVSKVTSPKKKQLKVTWNKQATQTKGYEIQYSTSSKFTKSTTKTVTVTNNKTKSITISKLKSKKKYYVRIRTYKNVNGNKYCSAWSQAKSIKVK